MIGVQPVTPKPVGEGGCSAIGSRRFPENRSHESHGTYLLAALAALVAVAHVHAAPYAPLYVAPGGNDANPGTVDKPLASLKGARDKVRAILAQRQDDRRYRGAVQGRRLPGRGTGRVWCGGFRHRWIPGHLPQRGCDRQRAVRGRAAAEGVGQTLEGAIWKKTGVDWTVGTMYENGKRAWRAREPNYKPDPKYPHARVPYLLTEKGSISNAVYRAGNLDPAGWTLTEAVALRLVACSRASRTGAATSGGSRLSIPRPAR